jgi:kynurenine formamidase
LAWAGCAPQPRPPIDASKLVDLTHPLGEKTTFWPTAEPFRFTRRTAERSPAGEFYSANDFCSSEHGGTHLDAPYHFAAGGQKADEIPLARLVGPACVIDVGAQAAADPDYLATVDDLKGWEKRHGPLPDGAMVVLRTGWSRRWGRPKEYLGDDTPGDASRLHFPGFSRELAEFLARERRIGAVGIDTASIDHGPSKDFAAHRVLYAANIPGFENLANLERLPEHGATLIALPAKIEGGTGAPLRAIAILP